MSIFQQFITARHFWSEMAIPDIIDYRTDQANLRRALHSAISLFHMHDWVFHTHEADVRASFTFTDKNGIRRPVSSPEEFANALEQQNADFGRIRGIANAGKHLKLKNIRPVQNAPSHAANTATQSMGFGQGPYGGVSRVMLEGANGNDMEFLTILENVYQMWDGLMTSHSW